MFGITDYISMALLALIGIAAFLNLRNGTFGQWFKAKFLGKTDASTPFNTSPAAGA